MASGFSGGGGPDFYAVNGGRSTPMMSMNNPPQVPYRSALAAGILPDPASQIINRGADSIGKRSLAEFQQQQQLLQQQQQFQLQQQQQQQVMGGLGGLYSNLRNVKPRVNYHHTSSPISPLSPVNFYSAISSSLSPEVSSISNSSLPMNQRYGLPILQQQLRQQQQWMSNLTAPTLANGNIIMGTPKRFPPSAMHNSSSFPNLALQAPANVLPVTTTKASSGGKELFLPSSVDDPTATEEKMLNRLHELEKELLDDDDNGSGSCDAVSVVTNSEWSDTIHNLDLIATQNKQAAISPSHTSSSSSCSSTSASLPMIITCPKQSINDVATAISEGRIEAVTEILTRLTQVSNVQGTPEQRLTAYMASALRSRVNPTEFPPPVSELYNKEHTLSTQMLYEVSPCFKLGFMAANLAILEAVSDSEQLKLHVIDFDVGQGGQYVHLLHALAVKKAADKAPVLKITTFVDLVDGGEDRVKKVGEALTVLANKIGVCLSFSLSSLKISELSREKVGVEPDEELAVNLAFRLYKLPDESVTTENLRDELLRRVKGLSPWVITVVEQEMNASTAPFVARVNEACAYYGTLFESLDATVARGSSERVRIEEGLGRKMANLVACEGRDRVERCEVFGKWRALLGIARFEPKTVSPKVAESLRSKLNSGTRGNPGFTVNEQSSGICFGWRGRTLTVASAWR